MSRSALEKMKYFSDHLSSSEMKKMNMDFLNLVHICNIQYSRNIYKKNGNWKTVKEDFAFNYDYVEKNNTLAEFAQIKNKLNFYSSLFFENRTKYRRDLIIREYSKVSIALYEGFIRVSMDTMVNNIIIPISYPLNELIDYQKKYANLQKKPSKQKSKKINYEALDKICGQICV